MQRKRYITGTGMIAQVCPFGPDGSWSTVVVHPENPEVVLHRPPLADAPVRETIAQAQEDLDRLAARLGWREVRT